VCPLKPGTKDANDHTGYDANHGELDCHPEAACNPLSLGRVVEIDEVPFRIFLCEVEEILLETIHGAVDPV